MHGLQRTVSVEVEQHQHLPCCHCCVKCHPPLQVSAGRCAICPVLGKKCQYGLQPENRDMLLSHSTNVTSRAIPRPVSMDTRKSTIIHTQSPHKPSSRMENRHSMVMASYVPQMMYIPVIPVQMVPVESYHRNQPYMPLPMFDMLTPRLAYSTMIPSENVIRSEKQITLNPEYASPEKSNKLKISLVSNRGASVDSPIKAVSSVRRI